MATRAPGRGRQRLAPLLAISVALALPGFAEAKRHSHPLFPTLVGETEDVEVRSDGPRVDVITVRCPPGTILYSPVWFLDSGNAGIAVIELSGSPPGAVFLIENFGEDAAVRVGVLCIDPDVDEFGERRSSHTHGIQQRVVTEEIEVPGQGEFSRTEVGCPKNFRAVNGALTGDDDGSSRVPESMPVRNGRAWSFGTQPLTNDDEIVAVVNVQCVKDKTGPVKRDRGKKRGKGKKKPGKHKHGLKFKYVSEQFDVPASPNPQVESVMVEDEVACKSGFVPVGTGWSFVNHPFTFLAGFGPQLQNGTASGRLDAHPSLSLGGVFTFLVNNFSTAHRATIHGICIGKKTKKAG